MRMQNKHGIGPGARILLAGLCLSGMALAQVMHHANPAPPKPRPKIEKKHAKRRSRRKTRGAIRLTANANCRVYLDHVYFSRILQGGVINLPAAWGVHEVTARTAAGEQWSQKVSLSPDSPEVELHADLLDSSLAPGRTPSLVARQTINAQTIAPQPGNPPPDNPQLYSPPVEVPKPEASIQEQAARLARNMENNGEQQVELEQRRQHVQTQKHRQVVQSAQAAYLALQAKMQARMQAELRKERRARRAAANARRPNGLTGANLKDGQNYIWIAANSFQMGCEKNDDHCHPDESPRHEVTLTHGFWLASTDVTVAEYARYARLTRRPMPPEPVDPHSKKGDSFNAGWSRSNDPIVDVTWRQAENYCRWAGGRLPTEAEWEDAARAGQNKALYFTGADISHDHANYGQNHHKGKKSGQDIWLHTSPVSSFNPNPFGFYDMAGDVWQWTSDVYDPNYYNTSPANDPAGAAAGAVHVVRGGAWDSRKRDLRLSRRKGIDDNVSPDQLFDVGFRCALDWLPGQN